MPTRLLTLLVLVAAFGAAATPAGAEQPPNPPDPYIVGGDAQHALDKARASWKAAKILSYGFQARRLCFCPTSGSPWHSVRVRRGVLAKPVNSAVEDVATVPRLFRVIQRAIDSQAHGLIVTYGKHGVPARIDIDSYVYLADEETYYTIRRFKRL
jgi:uncharacterized protein DUF6174